MTVDFRKNAARYLFDGRPAYNKHMKHTFSSFVPSLLFLILWAVSLHCAAQMPPLPEKERLQQGIFTIDYVPSQHKTAVLSLQILEEALKEFSAYLPAGEAPVHVAIADTLDDFDQYAVHFAGLDVSGVAHPGAGLIAVKAPRLREPGGDYAGTLRHELVHLLLFRSIGYDRLPQWLNEGLAMYLSNQHYWDGAMRIAVMFVRNRIIPYHELDNAFYQPLGREEFSDAYVQALYMTRQLHRQLGEEKFWKVIHALKEQTFGKALISEGGIDLETFCRGYEKSLWKYAIIALTASGAAFQPGAILLILAYLRHRRLSKGLYRKWEEEELEALVDRDPPVFTWNEVVEDPDFWKQDREDD